MFETGNCERNIIFASLICQLAINEIFVSNNKKLRFVNWLCVADLTCYIAFIISWFHHVELIDYQPFSRTHSFSVD